MIEGNEIFVEGRVVADRESKWDVEARKIDDFFFGDETYTFVQ